MTMSASSRPSRACRRRLISGFQSRIKLDHLADFIETMLLNDVGSWGSSFRSHQAEIVELVATLGSFDRSVLAAEAAIVLDRIETFGGHEPFFSRFDGASSRHLDDWGSVSSPEDPVGILIRMLTWGLGSAQLAASALWATERSVNTQVNAGVARVGSVGLEGIDPATSPLSGLAALAASDQVSASEPR